MLNDEVFLPPELEHTLYLLTLENRLKELKQECKGLIEHSKRLQRDRQLLIERFQAGMKRSQTLQMALERHLLSLRAKEEALLGLRVDLRKYLKDD